MRLRKEEFDSSQSADPVNTLQLGRSRETAESGDDALDREGSAELQLGRSRETAESRQGA